MCVTCASSGVVGFRGRNQLKPVRYPVRYTQLGPSGQPGLVV